MCCASFLRAFAFATAVLLMANTVSAQSAILGAVHQGSVQEDSIQWRSRFVFDPTVAQDTPVRAVLAYPLDPKLLTFPKATVEPVLTGDQVTSLTLRPNCGPEGRASVQPIPTAMATTHSISCTTDIYVVQPVASDRGSVHLQPPLLEGAAMQVVDVWGPDELMFIPDPKIGLEKRLTAFTPAGVDKDLPKRWDQRLGFARRGPAHKPLYVQSTDGLKAGIAGELTSQRDRMHPGAVVVAIAFVAVVGALLAAFLKLSRVARVERAERELQVNLRLSAELLADTPDPVAHDTSTRR